MNFALMIANLKKTSVDYLDGPCVLSLGAFLAGYTDADGSAHQFTSSIINDFAGPSEADAFTRAYLSYPTSEVAMHAVLDVLGKLVDGCDVSPEPGNLADRVIVRELRGSIQRVAMYIGTATVMNLYNYIRGFLCGLEAVAPVRAEQQVQQLADFERWLQVRYESPGIAWYKLIRIYGGDRLNGLIMFAERWDEFEGRPRAPDAPTWYPEAATGSVFNMLRKVQARPGMYLGDDNDPPGTRLKNLDMLLCGYGLAVEEHRASDPGSEFMTKFANYLRRQYGWSMSSGPIAAIRGASPDEEHAWQMFWKLVWEFQDALAAPENGEKGGPGVQEALRKQ